MIRRSSVAMLLMTLVACGSSDERPTAPDERTGTAPSESTAESQPESEAALDPRDQYALAREMLAAEQVELDDRPEAFARVQESWEGRRYRWAMMRVDGLCRGAASCLFAPFDLARFQHPVDFAFLPRVRFAEGEHERMSTACEAHALECVVTFEATLSAYVFDPGAPTSLTFEGARFVSARRRESEELFLSRPAHPLGSGPAVRRVLGAPRQ